MPPPGLTVRPERPDDAAAVRAVHRAAFPTADEAQLVDRMRAAGRAVVSLVAEADGSVVGHIVFSPVTVESAAGVREGLGLAPVAVHPEHQRSGIGSALVREGLEACRRVGCPFAVVLGHPTYYPRFGFRRGSDSGLASEFGGDDSFLVIEFQPGPLPPAGGFVRYGPDFEPWRPS